MDKVRVLIVDDHPVVREGLTGMLAGKRTGGMDIDVVGEAADVEEAVSLFRRLRPDVVLMDLRMPGMDGFETCRQLRARMGARMRIIALTGLGQERDKERSAAAGFDAHLTKPVDPVVLERLLSGKLALA